MIPDCSIFLNYKSRWSNIFGDNQECTFNTPTSYSRNTRITLVIYLVNFCIDHYPNRNDLIDLLVLIDNFYLDQYH